MSAAVLTAGVVLEHLLLPAVHDAQGHAAVVHDSYSHAFCIECAVANLHQQQPPLSVLRRKRLLLGLEAALDLLLCLSPQASAPPQQHQQHQHQHHGYYHHLGGISGGGGCPLAAEAAQRMLEQGFLGAVLRPIADPHEREELADALIGATLKTVEAALQQQQGDLALALLAAIYGPVLDAIREQGVRQAGHLLRLVAALLTPQGGLQDLGSLLLPSGSHSHSHSQTVSPPSSHPSVAAFTASFVAFVELLGAELATPVPSPGSGSAAAAAAARLEMLALLRRLCECPPARAWVVRQRIAPRVCGPAFFQSMQGLLGGGGGTGADLGDDLQRNLLALALLLLPSPARGGEAGQYDGGGGSLGGGGSSGSGEATGPDGGIVLNELLCWEAETFCPVVVKPLLLSGSVDLQQGAAAFVARLVQARPEAAESLVEGELAEHLLESLRVLLRSCNVPGGAAGVISGIYHHAAALRDLSRAAPLAFFSSAHWPPLLFEEVVALLLRVLEHSAGAPVLPPPLGHGQEGEGGQEDEEDATLLNLLDVVEGSLAQATVLFSEPVMAVLLQALHEATARQQRRCQGGALFLCQLAVFVGRYVSSINNKALFPSPPQLEALLAGVDGLLRALLQAPPRPGTLLLAAVFPLMQVAELVAARAGRVEVGDDEEDNEGGHPLVPALVEAAAALATLAAAQNGCNGLAEDHSCALFLSHVLALLPRASLRFGVLVRHLLNAGVLETALLRLAGHEGESSGSGDSAGGESLHVAFVALAAQLLKHGAGMGDGIGARAIQGPLLALARDMQLAEKEQEQQEDGEGSHPASAAGRVHWWLLRALRCVADPQQLQRWAMGSNGSLCVLDGLLGLWLCIGHRVPCEEEPAPDVLQVLASSIAAASSASLCGLTPTTVALLLRLAVEGTEDSSLLLQRAAAAVLAALPASELGAYVDAQIRGPVSADQPDHLTFLLCQGDQPGPQACWRLLLDMHMDNRQQQSLHRRFVATLHLLAANNDAAAPREASKGAVLALLLHGLDHALAAAAHPGRIRRCMELLLEASAAHGPAFWAADGASARAALVLLHDRVLPVLAASIDSSNDDTEWQDGQDALLLVVRVASAALLHAPPAVDLPFLPLVSRLLLLLGPRGGDRGSSSAPSPPGIVAAALALFNQLLALGRLPPDATRARAALELAWTAHATAEGPAPVSAALLTNALLHALVAFPSGTPTTTHHFYDRGFLAATCLAPQQPLPVRKAALVLLCRLLEEERAQQRLEQERQRPRRRQHQQQHQRHRSTQQQPSTTSNRRLRLAVQGCLLEPALRGPAAAALLQLFRLLPPAEPASAWDALLLRAPQALLPSQWPHAPSTSASYVALYMSAALQQRVRSPTAGAVDDEEEGETCALVAHLLQWLDLTSAALTQGSTDTLSPSYPVALTLLLALVEAGAATDAQRAQLRELCCPQASRSSTTVPDDIRMVSPMPSGQDEEDEAELTEGGVWWPPQLLERWMHAQGTGGVGCQQREQEEQDEEGAAPTPTRSDDVDLRGVVWRLREAVAE